MALDYSSPVNVISPQLQASIRSEEGYKRYPYKDTRGFLTIGVGRCIDPVVPGCGLSEPEAVFLCANDLRKAKSQAETLPWYEPLSPARKDVIVAMIFQMGLGKLLEFRNMQTALAAGYFQRASEEMLASAWAEQTPERAHRLAEQMRKGDY